MTVRPPQPAELIDDTMALLDRARAGDQGALEELFARHVPYLERWASGRLPKWARDISDTSDLVQDTVMETFKRLDAFECRGEGALKAYLRQAIINRIRTHLQRARLRPEAVMIESGMPADDTTPLEAAIGQQTLERYETSLARLRTEDRDAIVTRVEFGLSFGEVADVLGKPSPDAARMAVVRALMRLAEEMEKDAGPPDGRLFASARARVYSI